MSSPYFFLFKVLISGFLVALISTLAKRLPQWSALLTALPLVTFISLIWIYLETKDLGLIEKYTRDVLLWTLPSLSFFVAGIFLFKARVPFFPSLALATAALALTAFAFQKLNWLN